MKQLTIEETQKDTLKILLKVDSICEKLNIQYWGMYGTLIGAIRHKGFIPWDDDLDVCMKRNDYNKLLTFFYKNNNEYNGLYLDNIKTSDTCAFYITRICDKEHELNFYNTNHKSGLFVDIYPFDGMGNDKKFWVEKKKKIYHLQKMMAMSNYQKSFGKNRVNSILNAPLKEIAHLKGAKYYFDKMDKLSQTFSWDESKYVGLPGWGEELWFLPKDCFETTIKVPFEDTFLPIPQGYDAILTELYGDYMKLPPEEKRKPQHDYIAYKKG